MLIPLFIIFPNTPPLACFVAERFRVCVLLLTTCPLLSDWTSLSFLYFSPVVTVVNGEHLIDHALPPISWTSARTLPLQPLLQGWEQPYRTVSHQFCACRLLQTSSAALAHCTACSFPDFCRHCGELQTVQWQAAHLSLPFCFSFFPLSSVPLFHPVIPSCFSVLQLFLSVLWFLVWPH